MMSIKTVFKEHFMQSPFSKHINKHLGNLEKINVKLDNVNLELRNYRSDDTFQCAELFVDVFNDDPWFDDWLSFDYAYDYLLELVMNPVFMGFVVCDDSSEIVGVCFGHKKSWWNGKEFIIDEFFVSNNLQGTGIGSLLMDYVIDILSDNDFKRLILITNRNIPAEWFYIKNGFFKNENRIVMIKEINNIIPL
jgi:aminoglycoside 6'-N-acetyltransferase I